MEREPGGNTGTLWHVNQKIARDSQLLVIPVMRDLARSPLRNRNLAPFFGGEQSVTRLGLLNMIGRIFVVATNWLPSCAAVEACDWIKSVLRPITHGLGIIVFVANMSPRQIFAAGGKFCRRQILPAANIRPIIFRGPSRVTLCSPPKNGARFRFRNGDRASPELSDPSSDC